MSDEDSTHDWRERPSTFRRCILVVEDDRDHRHVLVEGLTGRGYEVVAVDNGRDALRILRARRIDAIVLALMMPIMDGWQFRIEQKREPILAETPVVAMSAAGESTATAIDADAYITRPFGLQELHQTLEAVIQSRERVHDAAERARTERLASLGVLAAGLAHEINNPLTYVLLELGDLAGLVSMLRAEHASDLSAAIEKRVEEALEGAERIRGVVEGVRTFARLGETSKTPVDVRPVLDSALKLVGHLIRPRARVLLDYRDCPCVLASEGRLAQVFINLLANAAQAVPEDNPKAHWIRVSTGTGADGTAWIEIADSGRGIPESIIDRIFDPFFTTKPAGEGSGLGLSLSQGIVRELGGEIRVSSVVDVGAAFEVMLPPASTSAREPLPRRAAATSSVCPRRRVLVVENEVMLRKALTKQLADRHDVVATASGCDAFARIAAGERFDLILCDLSLTDIPGDVLYDRIRTAVPEMADRVVFMTAEGLRSPQQGRDRPVLEKPFDIEVLLSFLT